jgi:hypothetical protein
MTTQSLQAEFERKSKTLCDMLEQEMIDETLYEALIERVRNETFFAVSVLRDIANINTRDRSYF